MLQDSLVVGEQRTNRVHFPNQIELAQLHLLAENFELPHPPEGFFDVNSQVADGVGH